MKRTCLLTVLVAVVLAAVGCQQATVDPLAQQAVAAAGLSPEILAEDARAHVGYLASDECAGRLTGTAGASRAGQYIAAAFGDAGLKPLSGKNGYFQPFEFTAGVEMVSGANSMEVAQAAGGGEAGPCKLDDDFRPLAFSANGTAEGEVVFVGYGIVEPQAKGGSYDSYTGLDVTGKIVLALRYLPEDITPQRRQELSIYAGNRYKAKIAADRGAKGFLLVTGPNSPNAGKLVKLRRSDRVSSVSIVAASISGEAAEHLLKLGKLDDLGTLQTASDGEAVNPHLLRELGGLAVRVTTQLERIRKTCRNVIGVIPPAGDSTEYVMVGAHYDHIGDGFGLGSLARQGEEGQIHNGADDNASGIAAVLELAAAVADARHNARGSAPRRGAIFACWSGEELGLIGSGHFANHPPIPLENIIAYFNFDMVGRLRDDKLVVQAVGSSPAWPAMIGQHNRTAGFDLTTQDDPYLPTDTSAFYPKGVPGLSFFTGSHQDYNRPTDDPDTLDYEGLRRIAAFARCLIDDTASPGADVAYVRVKTKAPRRSGGGARA
ncbi:MAG: M28 family peptidase, partial [Dehalococcoidia bacterium]